MKVHKLTTHLSLYLYSLAYKTSVIWPRMLHSACTGNSVSSSVRSYQPTKPSGNSAGIKGFFLR
jgi:hypothetical protein